jgi:hypothetical protein
MIRDPPCLFAGLPSSPASELKLLAPADSNSNLVFLLACSRISRQLKLSVPKRTGVERGVISARAAGLIGSSALLASAKLGGLMGSAWMTFARV